MKKLIIPIGVLLVMGTVKAQVQLPSGLSSTNENYIYTRTYLEPKTQSDANARQVQAVQYFDGLGRPKQVVNIKASPLGKDIVTHIEYDQFGRQVKDYLPVPQGNTSNGAIVPNPLGNAPSVYGNEKIYSEKILENSPLDRIQQQIQVGTDWADKPVKFGYEANITIDKVRKFATSSSWVNGATFSSISNNGMYGEAQLYKNTATDEDGNKTIEFKNGQGQIILVRKELSVTKNADTYYVYNEYNQLAFVIPPLLSQLETWGMAEHDALAYQYRYDGRGRLVEKKLPGKGWEYRVYDKQDRLAATRDAELESKGQWLYTKYDQFGRVAYTGINTGGTRAAEQNEVNTFGSNNVDRGNAVAFSRQGMDVYYGNSDITYPKSSTWVTLLSLNYYDSYPVYSFNPAFPANTPEMTILTDTLTPDGRNTKGLPVMSLVKNIEDDSWTKTYTYYDQKGRVIGTHSINHLGGYTHTESKLDFAGTPQQVITKHKRLNSDSERVLTETFEYDQQNRLLVHKHQVDSNPVEYLTQNKYNELSQLESKKVGGIAAASPLQQMDYKYNIQGWMTQINDPATLNGKLFGYKIKYNTPENPSTTGKFNGNIAEIDWNNSSENNLKRYVYEYDALNRLTNAFYKEPGTGVSGNFDEYLTYDLNGNISNLKRTAAAMPGNTATLVDNLNYIYTGNRLTQVIENAMNDTGYEGGNNIIDYDLNGSMTTMKDKGIQNIAYNHLNLPDLFSINQNNPLGGLTSFGLSYLYRADGTKVRKTYTSGGGKGQNKTTKMTDYLDGFQYNYIETSGPCLWCKTSVAYEAEAYRDKNIFDPGIISPIWLLDFVPTAEGFYSFIENRYIYQYKDHLGNARVSFAKDSAGTPEVTDTNNYYAFGMNHIGGVKGLLGGYMNYKYNGKELQETGMYDYGARMYMPDLGRWGVVDPLAEKMTRHSLYSYAFNNPLRFIDPDGRQNYDVIITGGAKDAALQELQKSVSSELALKMDNSGKVSYTQNYPKAKLSADAQQLVNAIDDHSVNVNVSAEYTNITKSGNLYVGGTFSGNKTSYLLNRDGSAVNTITNAYQEVNPKVLGAMSDYFNKAGADMLHEVTESYQGALISRRLGVNSGFASQAENDNPFSVYNAAHNNATPQTDGYDVRYFDKNGKPSSVLYKSGSAEFFVTDPSGVKKSQVVQTYP
ncbi:RHS repeat-associated core domain-containing protein [Chryseobacterium sp. MEBOG06]|uniref:DUF6443 domain-containing protein n=1 Tax=Chryseobacterium sp. MEBOG06 TaxID=2879938 RepID=UPI001F26E419|nr:DUF6443 domain-containing protein [Chryseobacterium sp. MEBOG06]UKB82243.1 RHS repeat-associated core domain-containing protein [Chryseobacterium sp. MEBOG06]